MSTKIYRFKFSPEICSSITEFSKLHQFDDRASYKDAWKLWCNTNEDLIENENERLQRLGYNHDIINKLYRSSRYYYRSKKIDENYMNNENNENNENNQNKPKRNYINLQKDIINAITQHINTNKENSEDEKFSPAKGYSLFCENNKEIIDNELNYLQNTCNISKEDGNKKIKKTYKNKYFQILH